MRKPTKTKPTQVSSDKLKNETVASTVSAEVTEKPVSASSMTSTPTPKPATSAAGAVLPAPVSTHDAQGDLEGRFRELLAREEKVAHEKALEEEARVRAAKPRPRRLPRRP